jgi:predicted exporter
VKRFLAFLWLVAVIAGAAYLCLRFATGIRLESNILALLPRDERNSSVQAIQDRLASSLSRRVGFLVGSTSPEQAAAAARTLSSALLKSGAVASLTSRVDTDAQRRMAAAYFPYRFGLLSQADRAHLQAGDGAFVEQRALSLLYGAGGMADSRLVARDPFLLMPAFLMSLPVPQSRLAIDGDVLSVQDDKFTYVLVSGDLSGDPYALQFQGSFDKVVSGTLAGMKSQTPDLQVLRTGVIFYAHEGAQEALSETSIIGIASIVGTLALILFVFHGLRPIALGALAIGTGIMCAFLGTLLVYGKVHVLALLFGVSVIGVSVDYSLQYFCEYFDAGATNPSARLRRVLPGVAVGLATTLIGYCTLLLAPFPGLKQVAAFSLIGLVTSCVTVVLWYPLLDSRREPNPSSRFVRVAGKHWTLWESPYMRPARYLLVILGCIVAFAGAARLRVDDDVHHLQSLPPDLRRQEAEFNRLTGSIGGTEFLLVQGADEEALLQTEEKLDARLTGASKLGSLTSLSQFVPSVARQKENRLLVQERLLTPRLQNYLSQIGYGGAPDYAPPAGFLKIADLPTTGPLAMLQLLNVTGANQAAHVVLLRDVHNADAVRAAIADLPGVQYVSLADDWSRLFGNYRRYAIALLALSALLMYPLLALRYGLRRGAAVLAPSLLAVTLAPLIAALGGVAFTFFNAMALVLVLSVGVDYSVFCIETSGERKPVTTLAIALAALSTILSFGLLALSRVYAVHAFGITMLIGIFIAFLLAPAVGDAGKRT